jgi:hypothetical protein
VPGSSLSIRLPTLVVWLSFGLRGPGTVGKERRHRRDDHAIDINNLIRLKRVTRRLNRPTAQHPQQRQIPRAIPCVDHKQGT